MPGSEQRKRHPEAAPRTDGFPRHPGWNTIGLGRTSFTRGVRKSGSPRVDNVFRLGFGIITGASVAIQLIVGVPDKLVIKHGFIGLGFIGGAIFGFWLAMLPCIVIAFAKRRLVKWLFWPAFGITAGGILLLQWLFS